MLIILTIFEITSYVHSDLIEIFFINLYIEIKYFNNTQDCKLIVYLEGNVTQQLLSIYIDFQIYVKDTIKI